ncbi:transposase family protein [Nocardia sp. N2S4-5]|uniref:transposase family protein n=1 Tax=Nocardia sp. N2S4-5 TaxID=3351565 RepID=UPI0037CFBFD3
MRDDGLASQSRAKSVGAGDETESGEATGTAAAEVRPGCCCGTGVLLGGAGDASRKRLAPVRGDLVATLRRFGELDIEDGAADLLSGMSAATIDRRLAPERKRRELKGRSHTKPGSLLKSQIPIRTWADWDDAVPGFVEIDLVGHDGGNVLGEHAFTLTVTDIATGWTENRSVRNKAQKWVLSALEEIAAVMPFPILGVDSDNGSEFINHNLLDWCDLRQLTFTRSRPGRSNDGSYVEQKNWAVVRTIVGYHRYDTEPELLLLNKIWHQQSLLTNYFYPQQKLRSKTRTGAKVSKKYDTATTRTAAPTPRPRSPPPRSTHEHHLHRHQPRRRATPHPGPHQRAAGPGRGQARPHPPPHPRPEHRRARILSRGNEPPHARILTRGNRHPSRQHRHPPPPPRDTRRDTPLNGIKFRDPSEHRRRSVASPPQLLETPTRSRQESADRIPPNPAETHRIRLQYTDTRTP